MWRSGFLRITRECQKQPRCRDQRAPSVLPVRRCGPSTSLPSPKGPQMAIQPRNEVIATLSADMPSKRLRTQPRAKQRTSAIQYLLTIILKRRKPSVATLSTSLQGSALELCKRRDRRNAGDNQAACTVAYNRKRAIGAQSLASISQKNSPHRHENRCGLLTPYRGRATHKLRHLERGFHDGDVWGPFFFNGPAFPTDIPNKAYPDCRR